MMERCDERFGCWNEVFVMEPITNTFQRILWRKTQEINDFFPKNEDAKWMMPDYISELTIVCYCDGLSYEKLKSRIALIDRIDRLKMDEVKAFYTEYYDEMGVI